ncbi:NTP transferase domain-containing protein [bacterium]|nr:NTP transferase domain-containing protein [bacterium]
MDDVIGIILAAGKGTRLNNGSPSEKPKVLHEIHGKPLITYCIKSLEDAGVKNIVVVVGYKGELVKDVVGNAASYAVQDKQLGTSHAVFKAKEMVKDKAKYLVVLNGDNPFFSSGTIKELVKSCEERKTAISLVTTEFSHPTGLGRIIKDDEGHIERIVEEKEATDEEKLIKEINAGCYCFNNEWLWQNIKDVELSPHGEYYLTDLISLAVEDGKKVYALKIKDNVEAVGINTKEHLDFANSLPKKD